MSGRLLSQAEHARINAASYPGTRQLCVLCDRPTDRCEQDSIYAGDVGPLCEGCVPDTDKEDGAGRLLDDVLHDGFPPIGGAA